jgi:uridine kinase
MLRRRSRSWKRPAHADADVCGVLEQLAQLIAAVRLEHPVRVGVDGPDAVGKTTLADRLVAPLEASGRSVVRASVDGFHRPRAERYRRGELSPEGYYLDSFDYEAVRRELLDPLGPGGGRLCRTAVFDFRSDTPVSGLVVEVPATAIVLVDGIFLQRPELDGCFDLVVYIDAPEEAILERARRRDGEVSLERYRARYLPAQRRYRQARDPVGRADVVVDNTDADRPRIARR